MSKRNEALAQIQRFTKAGFVPVPSGELEDELVWAFGRAGRDEAHIKQIGNELMLRCEYFPKPAQVIDAANAIESASQQPDEWKGMDAPKCPQCDGTGWISRDRVVNGVSVGVSSPCVCRVIEEDPEEVPRKSAEAQRLGELGLNAAKLRQIGGGK